MVNPRATSVRSAGRYAFSSGAPSANVTPVIAELVRYSSRKAVSPDRSSGFASAVAPRKSITSSILLLPTETPPYSAVMPVFSYPSSAEPRRSRCSRTAAEISANLVYNAAMLPIDLMMDER